MTPIRGIRNIEENDLQLSDLVAGVVFVFVSQADQVSSFAPLITLIFQAQTDLNA